jgi:hypothetical protein
MAQMDHGEAVRLQAAEKYVLGELPPVQRDEYEDHYIDCPECARDVLAAAAFADTAREVFRQEGQSEAHARDQERGDWLAWLKRVVVVPAFAVLLLFVVYQSVVTIPRAKQGASQSAAQFFTSSFSLQMANVRSGEEVKLQLHPNESFALKFDFTPSRTFERYICQLRDESGHSVLEVVVPGSSVNKEAQLVVPAGRVKPGKYHLVFTGASGSGGSETSAEVSRLSFSVEFVQ